MRKREREGRKEENGERRKERERGSNSPVKHTHSYCNETLRPECRYESHSQSWPVWVCGSVYVGLCVFARVSSRERERDRKSVV